MNGSVVTVGTRGSPLALAQTRSIVLLIKKNGISESHILVKTIKTEGDPLETERNDPTYSGKDSFTRAIDHSLANGEIDIAVHSLKDVPVESFSKMIEIAAFPKRESPFDVLITKRNGETLASLPKRARIGTSSVRRAIQLRAFRPDFEIREIHGNVGTRLERLRNQKNLDGIVLARAGLKRLGYTGIGHQLTRKQMLPAVGQGCLAVVVRSEDTYVRSIVSKIDDKKTRSAVRAERAFSRELGGGCNLPIAALANVSKDMRSLTLEGMISSPKRGRENFIARSKIVGASGDPESLGKRLAIQLKKIIEE